MRTYVVTTGIIFGLITAAHVLRVVEEGPHLARDPFFLLITVAAVALAVWAWRLLRRAA